MAAASGLSGYRKSASTSGSITGTCKASEIARVNVLLPAPLGPVIMVRVGLGAVIAEELRGQSPAFRPPAFDIQSNDH